MYGSRINTLFSLFVIISFILVFIIYKNILKNEEDIQKTKEELLVQQHQQQILQLKIEIELKRQKNIFNRMKETSNLCHDLHIFVFRPKEKSIKTTTTNGNNNNDDHSGSGSGSSSRRFNFQSSSPLLSKSIKRKQQHNEESEEQLKARRSMISGPIAYLFVTVLLYSLIKAVTEITQHFRKKAADQGKKRKCSLQEYASIKHERRTSKAQLTRRSTFLTMETAYRKSFNTLIEEQRINNIISPEIISISGQITEPGSPAKKMKNEIATKPAPFLRRCSVPAFALGAGNKFRRTSMDSFSEDDSSPDIKRRVRMIHRH